MSEHHHLHPFPYAAGPGYVPPARREASPEPPRPEPITEIGPHDVLNGRGVNIASLEGNLRFRALVKQRYDDSYCTGFTTNEKRALAEEIISHIKSLDPPGRFLRRIGRSHGGLSLIHI